MNSWRTGTCTGPVHSKYPRLKASEFCVVITVRGSASERSTAFAWIENLSTNSPPVFRKTISFQLLGLRLLTTEEDLSEVYNWRTCPTSETRFTKPARFMQVISPVVASLPSPSHPSYLLSSRFLVAIAASLFGSPNTDLRLGPKISTSKSPPYWDASGA